jgi:hypothetical protein
VKLISQEVRLDFLKYTSSAATFRAAKDTLVESRKPGLKSSLRYSMWCAFYVLYGRPFKQQKKKANLDERMVPKEYEKIHLRLITLRDKVYAHTDRGRIPVDDADGMFNKAMLTVRGGGFFVAINHFPFSDETVKHVEELTDLMTEKCMFHAAKIWKAYSKGSVVPDGNYEIPIGEGMDYLVKDYIKFDEGKAP